MSGININRKKESARSHEEGRNLLCAVCSNLWGKKAVRNVSEKEERLIQQNVLGSYTSSNTFFPSGICIKCIRQLQQVEKGEEVELKLPDNYFCQLDRQTRSSDGVLCQCRWCELARLSGSAFLSWQRRVKGKEAKEVVRLCQECYAGIFKGSKHVCSASTLEAVQNLTRNLPVNIQDKLALEILRQRQAEKSSSDDSQALFLPPARGGLPIPVLIGQKPAPVPPLPKFSHQELLTMASSAHLTGKQIDTVAADLRAKLGRNVVEAGFDDARVDHNNMYADYFCAEKKLFWDDENNIIEKATFWCHRSKDF